MLQELVNDLIKYNEAYRAGKSLISDLEYDSLIEKLMELDPNHPFLDQVGFIPTDDSRKMKLPIIMASMNKIKTIEEFKNWLRLKNIPLDTELIATPKFDGLSLCALEKTQQASTRGDGKVGQKSDEHFKLINNPFRIEYDQWVYGEVIMPKKVFIDKYSNDFANPRNLVAGLMNNKSATQPLKDCIFVRYGIDDKNGNFSTKKQILDFLNTYQSTAVNHLVIKASDVTTETLEDLFHQWSKDFEIDGIILEVNDIQLQNKLGRETSSENPVWARAFKSPNFEQVATTTILGISWNISKQGLLKPTIHVSPIKLDGVMVSNVTGNNARFVKDMGLGVGAKIKIKRSGMVIPLITEVIKAVDWVEPTIEGVELEWNENGIELRTITETDDQKLKQLISFFEILEVDNVGEGVITQLWNEGYQTIKDILELTTKDLEDLEGFGKRKAKIVYDNIQSKIKDVDLAKLQHATGFFVGLGSKKLDLLTHFTTKPTIDEVIQIEGFAEKSAEVYIENYDKFFNFIKTLPITISSKKEVELKGDRFIGKSFVFTGVRSAEAESIIESLGGKIGSSVSKNTSYLVMKSKGSGSSKETKALSLGVEILTLEELFKILK
jgi:NAD-dependent DNA ligase